MERTKLLTLTVGRGAQNTIQVPHDSVSGHHAFLSVHDGRLLLVDAGSSNGTFVNGSRVKEAFIERGDRVLLGSAPFPWAHPEVQALLAQLPTQLPTPAIPAASVPGVGAPTTIGDSGDDEPVALPSRSLGKYVAAVVVALGCVAVAIVVAMVVGRGETDPVGAVDVPQPILTVGTTTGVPVPDLSQPVAKELFAGRLADQVDVRRQEERVRDVRFRLSSQVSVDGFLFFNGVKRPRSSWAVPLGVVERNGRQALAVGTTRCVLDYRYPHRSMHRDAANFRNLALFSGFEDDAGRGREVFRLGEPSSLAGSGFWNGRMGRFSQHPELWARYRDLRSRPEWSVDAELVEGDWQTSTGVDFVVLYFPVEDPGVASLEPRARRTLQMRDPMARMQEALGGRTSLWGDTFRFAVVSEECMEATSGQLDEYEADLAMMKVFAVATAVVLVAVISGGAAAPAFAALKSAVGPLLSARALRSVPPEVVGAIWRTLVRTIDGERLTDVVWDEGGRLVVDYVRENGGAERIALAGLTEGGLSDSESQSIISAVRSLIERGGEFTVSTMRRNGEEVGAIMDADRRIDIASELLRRGLVRLDTGDESVLAQQPTLIAAAQQALMAAPGEGAISDPGYRDSVASLSRLVPVH
jgi:hypothetical protein